MPRKIHTYKAIPQSVEIKQETGKLTKETVDLIMCGGPVYLQIYVSLNLSPGSIFLLFYPCGNPLMYAVQTSPGELQQEGDILRFASGNGTEFTFKVVTSTDQRSENFS